MPIPALQELSAALLEGGVSSAAPPAKAAALMLAAGASTADVAASLLGRGKNICSVSFSFYGVDDVDAAYAQTTT